MKGGSASAFTTRPAAWVTGDFSVAIERGIPEKDLDEALDIKKMTEGGIVAPGLSGG